jgi:small multidrug resistance family-3 protein
MHLRRATSAAAAEPKERPSDPAPISGCFFSWAWLRLGRSPLWLGPGVASLIAFARLLTRVDADFAGCAYAAYGGIYIVASPVWLWAAEGRLPDR